MVEPEKDNGLLRRALSGDELALAALSDGYRERLRRMIRLRLDRRLSGRVGSSDVLQEAYRDVRRRIAEYARDPAAMPVHLWLRLIVGQKLIDVHRYHLGQDARRRHGSLAPSRPVPAGQLGLAGRPAYRQADQRQQVRDPRRAQADGAGSAQRH
jgi:hypothetical protein